MRLFIAIEIQDDIKSMIGSLRVYIPGARWVPVEQLHLTLAFLGEVEESTAGLLTESLSQIKSPDFDLRFTGAGCFPDRHRPRVLWIGLEPKPLLMAIAARVRESVFSCGILQEERRFSPHITLARLKLPASPESEAFLGQPQHLKLPPVHVREFTLFQSRLTPQGAVHVPLISFPLRLTVSPGRG